MAIATTVPSRQTSYMVDGEMTTRSQANVNSTLANGEVSGSTKTRYSYFLIESSLPYFLIFSFVKSTASKLCLSI